MITYRFAGTREEVRRELCLDQCEWCGGTGEAEVESPVYQGEGHMAFQGDMQKCLCKLNHEEYEPE